MLRERLGTTRRNGAPQAGSRPPGDHRPAPSTSAQAVSHELDPQDERPFHCATARVATRSTRGNRSSTFTAPSTAGTAVPFRWPAGERPARSSAPPSPRPPRARSGRNRLLIDAATYLQRRSSRGDRARQAAGAARLDRAGLTTTVAGNCFGASIASRIFAVAVVDRLKRLSER
jgi:hypothetical protein